MSDAPQMTEPEYLEKRLDDQIAWHEKKAAWNQRWFKRLQVLLIVSSALIPFVSAIPGEKPELAVRLIVAGLGVVAALIAGVLGIYQFQDLWVQYRATAETMKYEKYLYLTRTGPYKEADDTYALLVGRTEDVINKQNTRWTKSK